MRKAFVVPILAVGLALGLSGLALPKVASAQISVGISVRVGPPALPVYAQPICPGPDYIWVPGYWAYGPDGYYWVPGTWVVAPEPGYLWTPGWWGFENSVYVWHPGYWGPHVGFYGGIDYGYGYFGTGYVGGEWRGGHFFYNSAVSHVNVRVVRNVYVNRTVVRNVHVDRVSYNGGPHGINARPNEEQRRWDSERHIGPTATQEQHVNRARDDRSLHYNENHGRPPIGATPRPNQFPGGARPGNNRNQNEFHPPQNQNRGPQQNNERPQNRTFNPPTNQHPENRNYNQPQPNNRPENRNYNPPPQPNNRPADRNYNRPQPNNRPQPTNRPENRNYNAPQTQGHPGEQPHGQPAPRVNHPQAQPHNEPHGNQGGNHGRDNGGHDGKDGGR
jgi:WXXGXW repeat (2 copies)